MRTLFLNNDKSLLTATKKEALRIINKPTLTEQLQRWWETKYSLPSNHSLFQERTEEDLFVEYWVDLYEKHPAEKYITEDGDTRLTDTGDAFFDKWEEERADGIAPDLTEMFSSDEMEWYRRVRKRDGTRAVELQEAAEAHAANHPVERNIRARQEALARKLSPDRFPGTFGDD